MRSGSKIHVPTDMITQDITCSSLSQPTYTLKNNVITRNKLNTCTSRREVHLMDVIIPTNLVFGLAIPTSSFNFISLCLSEVGTVIMQFTPLLYICHTVWWINFGEGGLIFKERWRKPSELIFMV